MCFNDHASKGHHMVCKLALNGANQVEWPRFFTIMFKRSSNQIGDMTLPIMLCWSFEDH